MDTPSRIDRRTLIKATSALGAGAVGLASTASQAAEREAEPKVLRIGCLNVSAYSHLAANWASLINPRPGSDDIPYTGVRLTHCWEIDHDRAKGFAETYGCTAVKKFDDMLGKVDGIISGGYYSHPWNHILHEPYLAAGLPNLVNRPFSNSLAKARKMVETAKKHGATILVPSAFEHNNAIASAHAWARDQKIICYDATCSSDDYPTHGIHGVYMVCRAIADAGCPVTSASYRAKHWHSPPGILTYEHLDKDGRPFYGTLHQISGGLGAIRIHTEQEPEGKSFTIRIGTGFPYEKTEFWAPTLWAFEHMARTGRMQQSFDQILHKNNVFLAGWRSILANDGNPVRLEDVPEDWQTPVQLPNRPGDPTVSLFEKKFG